MRLAPHAAAILALAGCTAPLLAAPPSPTPASLPRTNATEEPGRPHFALEGAFEQGGLVRGTAPSGTVRLVLDDTAVALADDDRFIIAFDRDAASSARLVATRSDGTFVSRTLAIAPRAWRIERLDRLPRVAQPSAEFARRRPHELARIAAARAIQSDSDGWRQTMLWPVVGRVSGQFGAQRVYRGEPSAYHSGVDVALPLGTPVRAPADGVVVLAADAPFTLEGKLLLVDHGKGLGSAFLHLSRIDVRTGETVRRGATLGAVGATGRATGPHLHWGMTWQGRRIDPARLAGPMPCEP